MRIPRIFQDQPLAVGNIVQLNEAGIHHVINVLRLKPDAELILFNGDGHDYPCQLLETSKKQARVQIQDCLPVDIESPLVTHLALGISKGDRMDYAIQKSVELGVNRITPLITERSIVQLDSKRESKRLLHWQGVIQGACEQCGRAVLPKLDTVMHYEQFLAEPLDGQRMILDPRSSMNLSRCERPQVLILMIGPEGGFSKTERNLAYQHNAVGVQLGPRVLRTETAVVAGLSTVQTLWGDLDRQR